MQANWYMYWLKTLFSKCDGSLVGVKWPKTIFHMWFYRLKNWNYIAMLSDDLSFFIVTQSGQFPCSLSLVPCLRTNYIFQCGKTLILFRQKLHISFNFQLIHQNKAGSERGKITNCLHLFHWKHYSYSASDDG